MRVEEIVGRVLGIDNSKITDETSPDNTEEWDSLTGLLLATELEKQFDVKFSIDEIALVKNVGDIKKTLKRHGINGV